MVHKPHISRVPGHGPWFVFLSREARDAVMDEMRRNVHDNNRRHDAVAWGLTPEHAFRRYLDTGWAT